MTTLLLVPTLIEVSFLTDAPSAEALLAGPVRWRGYDLALTGMGPIDAGVGAAHWLAAKDYDRCLLAGLAGGYEGRSAEAPALVEVTQFVMDELGARDAGGVKPFEQLGFPEAVRGPLPLATRESAERATTVDATATALTVSACSGTDAVARQRMADHEAVHIEEMEGFAVARACRLAGVPLTCLRAIGNRVGDRDKSNWRIPEAMSLIEAQVDDMERSN